MRQEFKLIYIGILKFGFMSKGSVSIVGLIDYIARNKLKFDDEPSVHVNRTYLPKSDDWFWEIEMWNKSSPEMKCLVVFFDKYGCHYHQYFDVNQDKKGLINSYEDFMDQYRQLNS
jgi:hypothetical protein